MNEKFNISPAPHIRDRETTPLIMLYVLIALLPATVFGIYNFRGENAWMVVAVTVVAAVAAEYIYEKLMHKPVTIGDLSAAVTGLLLALNLPPTMPLWMAALGAVFAIIVVKQLFGGLGQNFMNPALAARCFMLISFTGRMTNFVYDGMSGATPLAQLKAGKAVDAVDMMIGDIPGAIGETSVYAILLGACFLLLMGVIDLKIPASYIISFVIFIGLFGGKGFDPYFITAHLCGGGLMLGAWFMATDYATSPITKWGQVVYGVFLGIMTGLFRLLGSSSEGVSYAILLGNLLVPVIEKATLPKHFGQKKAQKAVLKASGKGGENNE